VTVMEQFVIYFNPTDYPGQYVVRRWEISTEGLRPDPEPRAVVSSLAAARAAVPPGFVGFGRFPGDEPQVVEVWL
jgi:hypothetical protein